MYFAGVNGIGHEQTESWVCPSCKTESIFDLRLGEEAKFSHNRQSKSSNAPTIEWINR